MLNIMNEGSNHYVGQLPYVIVGSGGGYFRTGRVVKLGTWANKIGTYWKVDSGVAHNRLLASIVTAVGVPVSSYGTGDYGGPLTELT